MLPLAALLIAAVVFYVEDRTQQEALKSVRHTLEVRSTLRVVLINLLSAEAGLKSYLLNGDAVYLEPLESASTSVPANMERLEASMQGDVDQLGRLRLLRPLVTEQLAALSELQGLGGSTPIFPVHVPAERLASNVATTNEVRSLLDEMSVEEDRLIADRTDAESRVRFWSKVAIGATLLVGLIGGLLGMVHFVSGASRRIRRLAENARQLAEGLPVEPLESSADEIGDLERSLVGAIGLLRSEEAKFGRWSHVFEHSGWGVAVCNNDGDRLDLVNPAYANMHGYNVHQIAGESIFDKCTRHSAGPFWQSSGPRLPHV